MQRKLLEPPCDFGFDQYHKKRSQGPDRDGLVFYFVYLEIILSLCPKGLPLKSLVMIVLGELDRKHDIRSALTKTLSQSDFLDKVSDRICVACRHVRDLSKSMTEFLHPKLKELVQLIEPDSTPAARAPSKANAKPRPLTRQVSDASSTVQICSISCQCPECFKPEPPIDLSSEAGSVDLGRELEQEEKMNEDDGGASDMSKQAHAMQAHVPATRGGQKSGTAQKAEEKKETSQGARKDKKTAAKRRKNGKVRKCAMKAKANKKEKRRTQRTARHRASAS